MSQIKKLQKGGIIDQNELRTKFAENLKQYNLRPQDLREIQTRGDAFLNYMSSGDKKFSMDPLTNRYNIEGEGADQFRGSDEDINSNWFSGRLKFDSPEKYNSFIAKVYNDTIKSSPTSVPTSTPKSDRRIMNLNDYINSTIGGENWEYKMKQFQDDAGRYADIYKTSGDLLNAYEKDLLDNPNDVGVDKENVLAMRKILASDSPDKWTQYMEQAHKMGWSPQQYLLSDSAKQAIQDKKDQEEKERQAKEAEAAALQLQKEKEAQALTEAEALRKAELAAKGPTVRDWKGFLYDPKDTSGLSQVSPRLDYSSPEEVESAYKNFQDWIANPANKSNTGAYIVDNDFLKEATRLAAHYRGSMASGKRFKNDLITDSKQRDLAYAKYNEMLPFFKGLSENKIYPHLYYIPEKYHVQFKLKGGKFEFTPKIIKAADGVKVMTLKDYNDKYAVKPETSNNAPTGMRAVKKEKTLAGAGLLRNIQTGADLAMIAPGAVGVGAGVVGTLAGLAADAQDENVSSGQMWGNLALNTALTAGSLIGLGGLKTALKASKVAKEVATVGKLALEGEKVANIASKAAKLESGVEATKALANISKAAELTKGKTLGEVYNLAKQTRNVGLLKDVQKIGQVTTEIANAPKLINTNKLVSGAMKAGKVGAQGVALSNLASLPGAIDVVKKAAAGDWDIITTDEAKLLTNSAFGLKAGITGARTLANRTRGSIGKYYGTEKVGAEGAKLSAEINGKTITIDKSELSKMPSKNPLNWGKNKEAKELIVNKYNKDLPTGESKITIDDLKNIKLQSIDAVKGTREASKYLDPNKNLYLQEKAAQWRNKYKAFGDNSVPQVTPPNLDQDIKNATLSRGLSARNKGKNIKPSAQAKPTAPVNQNVSKASASTLSKRAAQISKGSSKNKKAAQQYLSNKKVSKHQHGGIIKANNGLKVQREWAVNPLNWLRNESNPDVIQNSNLPEVTTTAKRINPNTIKRSNLPVVTVTAKRIDPNAWKKSVKFGISNNELNAQDINVTPENTPENIIGGQPWKQLSINPKTQDLFGENSVSLQTGNNGLGSSNINQRSGILPGLKTIGKNIGKNIDQYDLGNLARYFNDINTNERVTRLKNRAAVDANFTSPMLQGIYQRSTTPYSTLGQNIATKTQAQARNIARRTSDFDKAAGIMLSGADKANEIMMNARTNDQQRLDQMQAQQDAQRLQLGSQNAQIVAGNKARAANMFSTIGTNLAAQELGAGQSRANLIAGLVQNVEAKQARNIRQKLYDRSTNPEYQKALEEYQALNTEEGQSPYYKQWEATKGTGSISTPWDKSAQYKSYMNAIKSKRSWLDDYNRQTSNLNAALQYGATPSYKKGGRLSLEERLFLQNTKDNNKAKLKQYEMFLKTMNLDNSRTQKALNDMFKTK